MGTICDVRQSIADGHGAWSVSSTFLEALDSTTGRRPTGRSGEGHGGGSGPRSLFVEVLEPAAGSTASVSASINRRVKTVSSRERSSGSRPGHSQVTLSPASLWSRSVMSDLVLVRRRGPARGSVAMGSVDPVDWSRRTRRVMGTVVEMHAVSPTLQPARGTPLGSERHFERCRAGRT
jgi:hypothetical protein